VKDRITESFRGSTIGQSKWINTDPKKVSNFYALFFDGTIFILVTKYVSFLFKSETKKKMDLFPGNSLK